MRAGHDTALALHGFNHNCAGVVANQLANAIQVIVISVQNSARHRPKALGVFGLATHADGKEGAAMKRLVERDDFIFLLTVIIHRPAACQLKRSFVGFTAGGA